MSGLHPKNVDSELVELKFSFLRVICDYSNYVALNLPFPHKFSSAQEMREELMKRHYVSGVLMREVRGCLSSEDLKVRKHSLQVLKSLVWKHDVDERYQSALSKQLIASLYFPLVFFLVEKLELVLRMSNEEQKEWMSCFVWVVKNVRREETLRKWWKNDTLKSLKSFLELVLLSLKRNDSNQLISLCMLSLGEDFMSDFEPLLKQRENEEVLYKLSQSLPSRCD